MQSASPPPASTVDPEQIQQLVHQFYGRVRANFSLGPIFDATIGADDAAWAAHLAKLCDFWETLILGATKYKGSPIAVHSRLPGLERGHFTVWLRLFEQTLAEVFSREDDGPTRERIYRMAERMAKAILAQEERRV